MGFDVYGKNAASDAGEYFRASVWSWRPIIDLMFEARMITDEEAHDWSFNEGRGRDAQGAKDLGEAMSKWLADNPKAPGFSQVLDPTNPYELASVGGVLTSKLDTPGAKSPYSTDRTHLQEWARFLLSCGGFEVW
jgi:hypothetical protein